MPVYSYEGKTIRGETKKGEITATSEADAQSKLRAQQIVPSKIRRKLGDIKISLPVRKSVKQKSLVIFSRQLATMIDAGLPLVQALDLLASQEPNRYFSSVIYDVKTAVESGATFADALKKFPRVFNDLFANLVAAGEVGGILDTILNRLAQYIEKSAKLKGKVKGAMVYPVAILVVAVLCTSVLLIYVIPQFAKMFAGFGDRPLPNLTLMVVALSDWVIAYGAYIFGGIVAFSIAFTYFYRTDGGRKAVDRVLVKLPLFGTLIQKVAIAKFTRTLGTLISSGVPILDALEIVARTAGNKTYETAIFYVRDRIAEGKNIAEPLTEVKVFPTMVVQMISVGESTGAMDTMLQKIADFYEEEVDVAVDSLTSLLEPLMMVILGGIVAVLMLAMYLPIFEMAGVAGSSTG